MINGLTDKLLIINVLWSASLTMQSILGVVNQICCCRTGKTCLSNKSGVFIEPSSVGDRYARHKKTLTHVSQLGIQKESA